MSVIVLVILYVLIAVQTMLFYVGCHEQCYIPSQPHLKTLLTYNRITTLVLFFLWIHLSYGFISFSINRIYLVIGLILIVLGQLLNMSVYKAISVDGVYYIGQYDPKHYEMIDGFPYTIPHPMYVGAIITICGLFLSFGFDNKGRVRYPVLCLSLYKIAAYLIAICFENDCKTDPSCAKQLTK